MSAITRAALVALQALKLPGGTRATAAEVNAVITAMIESAVSLLDDLDANNGYLAIDAAGRVDISKINAAAVANKFLRDDGTWADILAKVLTGFAKSGGAVDATDSILIALQKIYGNNPAPTRVTATPKAVVANEEYITDAAVKVNYDLPAMAVGDRIKVRGFSAGGWRIRQLAGQQIFRPTASSTVGVAGYIESTTQYDCVELLCVQANVLVVASFSGNLTLA